MVRAAFGIRRQHRARLLQIGVGAGGVEIVVFEKGRRRQHDIRHRRGLGQKLLVDADKQIVARKALGARARIPVRRPSGWCFGSKVPRPAARRRDRSDRRSGSGRCATDRGCGSKDRGHRALRSGCGRAPPAHGSIVTRRRPHMPRRRSRSAGRSPRKAAPSRCASVKSHSRRGYSCVWCGRRAGRNRRSRLRTSPVIAAAQAGSRVARWASRPCGVIGIVRHVFAVGITFLKQDVHHRAGERAIGAGQWRQMQIGGLGALGAVGVDDDQLRPAFAACRRDMGHHIDLGRDRVAAPDDDQIGFCHFATVDAALAPRRRRASRCRSACCRSSDPRANSASHGAAG